ncbi:MAG: formate dehydrogenase subunit gamma [Pseudomonadota bacterium]
MLRHLVLSCALGLSLSAMAQTKPVDDPAPPAAAGTAVPGATGGIQGQNIMDVKPEVKPDASSDPNYMKQSNGERNRVQPGNNAPMWRGVVSGAAGFTSIPKAQDPEAGVLIQGPVQYPGTRMTTAGEAWRQVRNNWLIPYGGSLFLIVLGALAIFYLAKGKIGHAEVGDGARKIERFTPFERSAHWANAIAFVILAVSGIVMAFGKFFLLPVMGSALFGFLTYILKTAHNFAGPLFVVSLIVVFLTFLRDNFPQRGDLGWLLRGGGLFGKSTSQEPPSNRFNAGEKVIFWGGVLVLGFFVASSGLVLDKLIPGMLYDRQSMQVAHMVHAASTVLMMCLIAGHIYIGTIGMRGAYSAMRQGWVGEEWAKEHHAYWYEDIKAGKIPAVRSEQRSAAGVSADIDNVRPA